MPQKKQKIKEKEVFINPGPTSTTDAVRTAKRQDGSVMMQFISDAPDFQVENHRTVISSGLLERVIDTLCQVTDYYPKRKTTKKKTVAKKKSVAKK